MFALIDKYDSFTYNLWHYLGELNAEVGGYRKDAVSVDQVPALDPEGIVISPGPCDPDKGGICLNLIRACAGDLPPLRCVFWLSGGWTGVRCYRRSRAGTPAWQA